MKIGVIGGGQLGRMLALAGTPLGMDFAFLDPAPDACAQALGEHIRADYSDLDHLRQLADEVDLVTFEFESVPAETVVGAAKDPATMIRAENPKKIAIALPMGE